MSIALTTNRRSLSAIVGFITGHIGVKKHLYNIGVSSDPKCQCGEIQSVIHLVTDCPVHVLTRSLYFGGALIHEEELTDLDHKSVLSFLMAVGIISRPKSKVSL